MHCQKTFFSIIIFENPVRLNMRLRMQLRSATVEKMAGIFTKRIWQPYHQRNPTKYIPTFSYIPNQKVIYQAL